MSGYGPGGPVGHDTPATGLFPRALYLEDEGGNAVAFVALDLHSGTRYLHEQAAIGLAARGVPVGVHQLVVFGTHTHTAPAHFYGNSLYDAITATRPRSVDVETADVMAAAIVVAVSQAFESRRAATVHTAFGTARIGRNRSLPAALKNLPDTPGEAAWADPMAPWNQTTGTFEERRSDPRIPAVVARETETGKLIGAFATVACHNTLVPPSTRSYNHDWIGAAGLRLTTDAGAPVLIGVAGAGDQTPLPSGKEGKDLDEAARIVRRALLSGRVFDAIKPAIHAPGAPRPIRLAVRHHGLRPLAPAEPWAHVKPRLTEYFLGAPTLGGAEDFRSAFHALPSCQEGTDRPVETSDPHSVKRPALGLLQKLFKTSLLQLKPSPEHALHAVQVNDHLIITVPGEPTVSTAWWLERSSRAASGAETASVLGYSGDYAGYFTTPAEYTKQHYEGSSTIYGRHSVEHLVALYEAILGDDVLVSWWSPPGEPGIELYDAAEARILRPTQLVETVADAAGRVLYVLSITTEPTERTTGLTVAAYGRQLIQVTPRTD